MKILLLALLCAIGCGSAPKLPLTPPANSNSPIDDTLTGPVLYDSPNFNGTRLIFNPGLGNRFSDLFKDFLTELTQDGFQVLVFPYPNLDSNSFIDGGVSYRAKWTAQLTNCMQWSVDHYGEPTDWIIAGGSFGGLNSLMGAAIMPGKFKAVLAMMTVTKIGALTEYYGQDTPFYDPTVESFGNTPIYVTWGTADMRVNWNLAKAFSMTLNNPFTHEYVGMDHDSTPAMLNDAIQFILAQ